MKSKRRAESKSRRETMAKMDSMMQGMLGDAAKQGTRVRVIYHNVFRGLEPKSEGERMEYRVPWFPGVYPISLMIGGGDEKQLEQTWPRTFPQRVMTLFKDPSESKIGKVVSVLTILFILISIILMALESMPAMKYFPTGCGGCAPLSGDALKDSARVAARAALKDTCTSDCLAKPFSVLANLEIMCVAGFSAEYFTRLLFAPFAALRPKPGRSTRLSDENLSIFTAIRRLVHFVTRPLNIIDLLSILPFYLALLADPDSGGAVLAVLRIVRIVRIFRLFKMEKFQDTLHLFSNVVANSTLALFLLFMYMALCCIIFGSLMFFAEEGDWEPRTGRFMRPSLDGYTKSETPFTSIPSACWWVIVTMTTVGYGDTSPTTVGGQIVGVLTMLSGVLCVALPVTVLGANFANEYDKFNFNKKRQQAMTHYCGWMVEKLTTPPTLADAWGRWCQQVAMMRIAAGDDVVDTAALVDQMSEFADRVREIKESCSLALQSTQRLMESNPQHPAPRLRMDSQCRRIPVPMTTEQQGIIARRRQEREQDI